MMEVLIAMGVLSVGLMASALLMSNTYKYSVRSRYMSEAAQLASEKLEDLNRYPVSTSNGTVSPDPNIFVPSGANYCGIAGVSCVGNLSSNAATLAITAQEAGAGGTESAGASSGVSYSDEIFLSTANGTLQETYQTVAGASPQYTSLSYSPNGLLPVIQTSTTAPTTGETFSRRWVIEQDQPIAGVRRITVLVTLVDDTIQPPVKFQMSMVRP
jgi:Tfp pilus assembly protein PilV